MFIPKQYHKFALKILACDLKQRKDHGLVLNSNYYVCKVDAYPDAIFLVLVENMSLLTLHMLRAVPDISSCPHIFLFCEFKSYRPRMLS